MQRVQYYSLTDQVYHALKRDIVQRKMLPNAKLDVNGLAQELGVSRMPVVDALTRLESEGLVEKRNRVGTFVTPRRTSRPDRCRSRTSYRVAVPAAASRKLANVWSRSSGTISGANEVPRSSAGA